MDYFNSIFPIYQYLKKIYGNLFTSALTVVRENINFLSNIENNPNENIKFYFIIDENQNIIISKFVSKVDNILIPHFIIKNPRSLKVYYDLTINYNSIKLEIEQLINDFQIINNINNYNTVYNKVKNNIKELIRRPNVKHKIRVLQARFNKMSFKNKIIDGTITKLERKLASLDLYYKNLMKNYYQVGIFSAKQFTKCVYEDAIQIFNNKGGKKFIYIKNKGKRKIRYFKNGNPYIILNGIKKKINIKT